jgi:hypothetical protein
MKMTKLQRFNNQFRHLKLIFKHNRILINYQSIPVWTLMNRMLLFSSLYNNKMVMRSRNGWICNIIGNNSSSRILNCSRMIIFSSRSLLKRRHCYKSTLRKYPILVVVELMMILVFYMNNKYYRYNKVTCKPLHWLNLLYKINLYNNQLLKLDLQVLLNNNLLLYNNNLLPLNMRNL